MGSKEEVARTPKAREALDLEWNKLRTKGVWDEELVRELHNIVQEARRKGEKVHLGRIFEACYEKGSELPENDPRRKFKGRTVLPGQQCPGREFLHCSLSSAHASPQWRLPRYWMPSVANQGMGKNKQMLFKHMSKQPLMVSQHGLNYLVTGGLKDWEEKCWKPMVPMVLALYGRPDSGGIWEQHLNASLAKKRWRQILLEMWQSIFRHDGLDLILVVYVDDFKMAGPKNNLAKGWAGIRSVVDLGEPEPYDRYFGRMHVEKNGICTRV